MLSFCSDIMRQWNHNYYCYFRDFVLYNYTVNDIVQSLKGQDNNEITEARLAVRQLLAKTYTIPLYTATDICINSEKRSFYWKKMKNVLLSGVTSIGEKTFDSLKEAKTVAMNLTEANSVTFHKKLKHFTLSQGVLIVGSDSYDSWVKIPLTYPSGLSEM